LTAKLLCKVVVTPIGPLAEQVASIQFTSTGVLYAVTGDGSTTFETLFTVNKSTAAMTLAYPLGNGSDGETIGFDPTTPGVMYHCSGLGTAVMETIDLGTGMITNIVHNYTGELTTMAYDSASGAFFCGDISGNLNTLTTAGVFTFVGNLTGSDAPKGMVVVPSFTPSSVSLNLGTTTQGTASTPVSFDLEGHNLFGDVTISPPPGVVVSLTSSGGFGPTLSVPPDASGELASTTIYVRIQASTPAGPVSGNLDLGSTAAGGLQISVTGQVDPPPTAPEMDVFNGATPIANGATDPMGAVIITTTETVTYTVQNTGNQDLLLNGTPIVDFANLSNVQNVSLTAAPTTPVAMAGSTNFTITYEVIAVGAFSFDITIDNDDANENPYVWTVSGTGDPVPTFPEIDVMRGAIAVVSGGADTLGSAQIGTVNLVYTISNTGTGPLAITTPVTISGETNCTVNVTTQPGNSVAAAGSTTLGLSVIPTAAGAYSFMVSITNDDANENPYVFTASGTATAVPKSKGDSGGDDGGNCTAVAGAHTTWIGLLMLLGMLAVTSRKRREKA
jgi:hypothetical protein